MDEPSDLRQKIEQAASEWRQTFDAVEVGILVLDPAGKIQRANRFVGDLCQKPPRQLVGQPLQSLACHEPWSTATRLVESLATRPSADTIEVREPARRRCWDLSASRLADPEHEEPRILLVLHDVTRRVSLERALRHSEKIAAMGRLVAGVSHEVRNPLFGISATLDAFEARFAASDDFAPYLGVLRRQVDRMMDLMTELLEYGRPTRLARARSSFPEVIAAALRDCENLAERREISIEVRIEEDLPRLAMDRPRLISVVKNLVENAVQHAPPGSTVRVSARKLAREEPPWIETTVDDNGPGFADGDLDKIFEPFFSRRRGGTGLGLAIVYRIVEDHGGTIAVSNLPAGGARVRFYLPVHHHHDDRQDLAAVVSEGALGTARQG